MQKGKKFNFAVALVLVMVLALPQVAFAFAGNFTGMFQKRGTPADGLQYVNGELIIKIRGDYREEARMLQKYKLTIKRRDSRLGYILAATPRAKDIQVLVRSLQNEETVEYVQPNYKYHFFAKADNAQYLSPNDPQYARQWALPKINVRQRWAATKAGPDIIVAVLDSGIDVNHPDLKNMLVLGTNTVNPLKSARDDEGHGTHVAGIIGAAGNNGIGVSGIAGIPGVKIMPVKVFNGTEGSDISISDGIIWAADHGAKVINMSFGSYFQSDVLNDAIDYAYNKGIVLVAAAGNWASQEISYPAALSKVIAVSATDRKDQLADFSSYGPQIDVSAPGKEIYSTYWDPHKGSTYRELSGTSMASPMVAGLAAVILAQNPKLTNDEVRQVIEESAADLGDPGWDTMFGYGRIDVQKALSMTLIKQEDSNESMLMAVELKDGVPYQEKINSGKDVDWYKINVSDMESLQIEVQPAGKVSPGVEVYDETGNVVTSFNNENTLNQRRQTGSIKVAQAIYGLAAGLEEGVYYIKIFGNHFRWAQENYAITARLLGETDMVKDAHEPNESYTEAKPVTVDSKVTGAILASGEEDWFKIELQGGAAHRLRLDVPEGLDLAVEVESATNYQEPSSEAEWINFDERWFWETVNNTGPSEDEDSVLVTPAKGTGTYYIKVFDVGGAAVNANYTLTMQPFVAILDKYESNNKFNYAAAIPIGDKVSANFHHPDDKDWYLVDVPGTGILKLDFNQPPGVILGVDLYSDPEADPVNSTESSGIQAFEFKVIKGTYYLRLTNYGNISAENYTFKTWYSSFDFTDTETNDRPSQAKRISLNETKTGTLYPAGDFDFYFLDIEEPQALLVSLAPPGDLDTVAAIFKQDNKAKEQLSGAGEGNGDDAGDAVQVGTPDGNEPLLQIVAEINSGEKGMLDTGVFMATQPGRYYVGVAETGTLNQGREAQKSLGKYTLTVKPFKVQPDRWEPNNTRDKASVISNGGTVFPTFMGTEDIDWFKVYAPGRGKLTFNLAVPSDIDGVLEVYNQAGKLLTKVDQTMVGEKEFTTLSVPKAGYYYIKTYDYLGNSSVQTYSLAAIFTKN